jgi:hypothetical protein
MIIYIAGKITGIPLEVARANFKKIEKVLLNLGHTPMNPMRLNIYSEEKSWNDYMVESFRNLLLSDGIIMLRDWRDSKGAKLEHVIAKELKKFIIYESDCY